VILHVGGNGHLKVRDFVAEDQASWDAATSVEVYCDWLHRQAAHAVLLLPAHARDRLPISVNGVSPLWYDDDTSLDLPLNGDRGTVFLVNGNRMPVVDWAITRRSLRQYDSEVVVFGTNGQTDRPTYDESVEVNESGEVLRFRRHYHDSPAFTDLGSGEACFLAVAAHHATRVARHLVARGWGLDSIGALTRQFSVRWSDSPCVRGGLFTASTRPAFDGPGEQATASYYEVRDPEANGANGKTSPAGPRRTPAKGDDVRPADPTVLPYSTAMRPGRMYRFMKRSLDIVVSLILLALSSPVLLIAALLIKATSRGPVFFSHVRQGRGGKEFKCLKFRTMVPGADLQQAALRAKNEVDGPQFKITHDPRLTRVGNFLRRYNIDEIPQFINVVLGDMSLVGPRPSPDRENQLCPAWRRARLSVRPGVTGLWQVLRLRTATSSDFQEWIYYDIEYVRHTGFWLDVLLLAYTPISMFRPRLLGGLARRLERRGICRHSPRLDAAA
jgi:lipopolysaccharide/colanic/teichoic acid biosynthesis glycosyltransferase